MTAELPNGDRLELPDDATGLDAARAIGEGLARAAIAIEVDGEIRDLTRPLPNGDGPAKIRILTERDPEALEVIRHDAAHVLAETVKELYPGTKISIGPPIADGFYYDFDFPDGVKVGEEDLSRIEEKMREHIKADEKFERTDISSAQALELFKGEHEDYKVELIQDLGTDTVSLYRNGDFTDLCRGPHGPGTKRIKAVKLTSVAGAYWRGDSERPMLTRIYGTAFFSKEQLEEHLKRIEEAKARDHRKLGRELGLFEWDPVSPGATFWHPKGTTLFNELVALNRQMQEERGYVEVKTPQLYESTLWETSGHWGKYKENIFVAEYEEREFGLKPMNCPGHCKLFSLQRWSYRDLPFRCAEPGLLHRREPSGTLHGLLRVRHFCQDDAHVFCREDQVQDEVAACLAFGFDIYNMFGFPVRLELSTRPEPDKRLGDDAFWDKTEGMLRDALDGGGYEYKIAEGEGAFYAPKIDLHMTDTLGRSWQLGTVQLDYNMPERFGLTYNGADNAEHMPVMIHRALFGSFERFIGILLEHTAGELPFWLAPVQASVLPIADDQNDYARDVAERLSSAGLRADVDDRTESIGKKIRAAELQKVPYMLVVGKREAESGEISLRKHREGDIGSMSVNDAVERLTAATLDRE
ncbi:MAG TPA: threonine--tRNA ligase [Thermoleophilaceae bacterium]|nr:threonine--tRNA ligase [Thermoleophilaceae bacterium]